MSGGMRTPSAAPAGSGPSPKEIARLIEHLRTQLDELDRREANLNRQFVSLDNERRAIRLSAQQSEQQAELRTKELDAREDAVGTREAAANVRESELNSLGTTLSETQARLESQRASLREDVAREFAAERDELIELRRQHELRDAALNEREATVTQSGIDLEKRTRLHEDHLTKLRGEIAEQRSELDRTRQRQRTWSLQVDESIRFRLAQLRRFRELLDQRERSFDTECELQRTQRESTERELARQRDALAVERVALAKEAATQQSEIRRQQDMLTAHSENLDGRRQRLDKLRDELEATHQESLEMRMAVEQAFAEVARDVDEATAQERVQTARSNLFEYYRDLRESLNQRRHETEDAQRQLQEMRDNYREERDEQLQRLADREDELLNRQRILADEAARAAAHEAEWQAAQEGWRENRLEAERVIRDLIHQLERSVGPPEEGWAVSSAHSIVPLAPDGYGHGFGTDAQRDSAAA
jgi:hypothetical protein